jgi:hypothetical protein
MEGRIIGYEYMDCTSVPVPIEFRCCLHQESNNSVVVFRFLNPNETGRRLLGSMPAGESGVLYPLGARSYS